jgi:hypothetical protein
MGAMFNKIGGFGNIGKVASEVDDKGEKERELDSVERQSVAIYDENLGIQKKRMAHLKETVENDKALNIGDDTYAMGFKAMHLDTMTEMNLNMCDVHDAFQAALSVFFIQFTLIGILALIVFTQDEGFSIKLPPNLAVLAARFVCSILMHLQVEGDMRQGLSMMKYVCNHSKDFSNPFYAFCVALMQCLGGMGAEIFCILFLCSLTDPIMILIRFVAFASIGKVDDFYASALSPDHKMKKDSEDMMITKHRRDTQEDK